jgi:endonuclease/exonuclease/phosphatase family metal-dependent hydrolase
MGQAPPLRIASYNVRYFGHAFRGLGSSRLSKNRIALALAALDPLPDVICFQEVETRSLRSRVGRPSAYPEETQLESFMTSFRLACGRLDKSFPFEALYFRAHQYRLGQLPLYTTGLAVLVNEETLRIDRHNALAPQAITHHHVARWKDTKQSRICAHLHVHDRDGRTLHLFNTHLSLATPFARDFWASRDKLGFGPNQVEEAKKLATFVKTRAAGQPFVITGDFNSPPGSPVYRELVEGAGFTCAQAALGFIDERRSRAFPTAGFLHLRMHLDHLFSGNGIRWLDLDGTHPFGEGPFHGLSDHVPLIGRFAVPDAVGRPEDLEASRACGPAVDEADAGG